MRRGRKTGKRQEEGSGKWKGKVLYRRKKGGKGGGLGYTRIEMGRWKAEYRMKRIKLWKKLKRGRRMKRRLKRGRDRREREER
jgi:hypothetical protein